jgi:hypothetical protein
VKGNCHHKGAVEISASSAGDCSPVHRVVDYQRADWFFTGNFRNSWVKVDFKSRRVWVDAYEIKGGRTSCTNLRTWVLEGSNDEARWTVLDDQIRCRVLSGESRVASFPCTPVEPFRYVRLRQTDFNDKGNDHLVIANLELYGFLID